MASFGSLGGSLLGGFTAYIRYIYIAVFSLLAVVIAIPTFANRKHQQKKGTRNTVKHVGPIVITMGLIQFIVVLLKLIPYPPTQEFADFIPIA